jgi:ribosomal protein S4
MMGHVSVNGKKVKGPNFILEDGDIVQITRLEYVDTIVKPEQLLVSKEEKVEASEGSVENSETKEPAEEGESFDKILAQIAVPAPTLTYTKQQLKQVRQRMKTEKYPSYDLGLNQIPYMAPWMFVPEYLEVNYNNLSVCFLRSPTIGPGKCEVPSPFDDITHQRAYDFYCHYRSF